MNKPYTGSTFQTKGVQASRPEPARHFEYFGSRLPDGWWSAGFGFAIGLSLLAASIGQRLGVVSFLGLTGILTLLFPHAVVRANARNATLWLFAAWALFSAVWSINPDRTLHSAALLLATMVAGVALGGIPDRRAVVAGLGAALVLYMCYSVAVSSTTAFSDTGSGGEAMTGLTTGKNYFGHVAAMTFLTTPIFLTFAQGRWVALMRGVTLFAAAISGFALYQSHATGSMLAAVIGMMVLLTVLLIRHVPWQFRIVVVGAMLGVMILYVIFGQQLQDEVFNTILRTFRKDASLTGRTVLWAHADQLIDQRRLLGYGYSSFWHYTNPDALTLWRLMGVTPWSGFNFHNTMRDTTIDLGWIGFALYVVSFGYALFRTALRSLSHGGLTLAVGLGFLSYFVVRMPVETTGISAVTIDTVMILTLLCMTITDRSAPVRDSEPELRRAPRRPDNFLRDARAPVRTGFVPARRR